MNNNAIETIITNCSYTKKLIKKYIQVNNSDFSNETYNEIIQELFGDFIKNNIFDIQEKNNDYASIFKNIKFKNNISGNFEFDFGEISIDNPTDEEKEEEKNIGILEIESRLYSERQTFYLYYDLKTTDEKHLKQLEKHLKSFLTFEEKEIKIIYQYQEKFLDDNKKILLDRIINEIQEDETIYYNVYGDEKQNELEKEIKSFFLKEGNLEINFTY